MLTGPVSALVSRMFLGPWRPSGAVGGDNLSMRDKRAGPKTASVATMSEGEQQARIANANDDGGI